MKQYGWTAIEQKAVGSCHSVCHAEEAIKR